MFQLLDSSFHFFTNYWRAISLKGCFFFYRVEKEKAQAAEQAKVSVA